MKKDTLKFAIIKEFEKHKDFVFAGVVSNKLAYNLGVKASNLERRMRELHEAGRLERAMLDNPRGNNKVVGYKIRDYGKIEEIDGKSVFVEKATPTTQSLLETQPHTAQLQERPITMPYKD